MGLVWTTVWWIVVKESPEKDPHITAAELKYIQVKNLIQVLFAYLYKHANILIVGR